ncbi:hypothetical protein [Desulforamulus aquiferis]|uniref:Uncharacterized protein n=1 Tax=Desulforamulus aquiferis TaxID=1397668 RepID=A0AAW7Z9U4_9FIRM|nr:hypothetical protein [Desulforamulus aquiferis]MDO7785625.1 hypothetical protein [Desulforamulus aquiferis]
MIMDSKGLCHPWWVFPTALAFGFGIAVIMGAPIGRQVNRAFSVCQQQPRKPY